MTIHNCDWCDRKITGAWIQIYTEVEVEGWAKLYSNNDRDALMVYDEKTYDICPACFEQFMRTRFIKKT